jgi:hypothetical protein
MRAGGELKPHPSGAWTWTTRPPEADGREVVQWLRPIHGRLCSAKGQEPRPHMFLPQAEAEALLAQHAAACPDGTCPSKRRQRGGRKKCGGVEVRRWRPTLWLLWYGTPAPVRWWKRWRGTSTEDDDRGCGCVVILKSIRTAWKAGAAQRRNARKAFRAATQRAA